MKQECNLVMVWLTWLGIPALAIGMGVIQGWWAAVFILIVGMFDQAFYIKVFPRISRWLGYGSAEDVAIESTDKSKQRSVISCPVQNSMNKNSSFFNRVEYDIVLNN
jgi:hypothetical protein